MIVLGIDPGSRRIGYGVIVYEHGEFLYKSGGILKIESKDDVGAIQETCLELESLVKKWQPSVVGVEKLYFTKNQRTGIQVAQARGAILAVLGESGVKIRELTPNEIKLGITGDGAADKRAVAKMVCLSLREPELKLIDDAMDALAIAIVVASRERISERMS